MILMANNKRDLTDILEIIIELLDNISDKQFTKLLKGEGRLVYIEKETHKKSKNLKDENVQINDSVYEKLGNKIKLCKTREEAFDIMKNEPLIKTKNNLLKLSEIMQIYANKKDKRERIEEKIVESLVGSKIRSDAIRNLSLK